MREDKFGSCTALKGGGCWVVRWGGGVVATTAVDKDTEKEARMSR